MGATLPAALAGAPPPIPPPQLPPQVAAAAAASAKKKNQPQHSALRDRAQFDRLHASSVATPSAFWSNFASGYEWRNSPATSHSKQRLDDDDKSNSQPPPPPWFVGGRLNVALNCLDRHVAAGRGAEPAFVWPSSSSSSSSGERSLSYEDAASRVAELASWLSRSAGVGAGDAVAIMLPPGALESSSSSSSSSSSKEKNSGPLLALAFLAVARVGGAALLLDPSAPAGDNGAALAASGARVAVVASGGRVSLGGPLVPIKERFDAAAADACFEGNPSSSPSSTVVVETVLCFECEGVPVAETPWKCSRDVWASAALSNDNDDDVDDGGRNGSRSSSSSAPNVAAWPDANAPLLLSQAPGTSGSTLLAYPGAGLLVCAGAASRLALDASSNARVAVACSDPWSEAAVVFGVLGPLANGGSVVALPPCRGSGGGGGGGESEPSSSSSSAAAAGSWWAAAAKIKTTHVVADVAAAAALARSASSSGGAPPSVVAAMVVDSEPSRVVVEALASSIGDREEEEDEDEEEDGDGAMKREKRRRPVVAAWMPAGSGCPVLAGAPFAAEASRPGGMLPWLGCAPYLLDGDEGNKGGGGDGGGDEEKKKKKKTSSSSSSSSSVGRPALGAAWPSMARSAMGPDSSGWLRDSVLCGPRGEFSPPTALFEVNEHGEWYWAEAKG